MTAPTNQQEAIATWSLIAIGLMLLVIAIFLDPVGSSPDSGIVDLGSVGTRWLLGGLGGVFVLGGAWGFFKKRFPGSR